jgi:NADH dehydrogenase
LANHPEIFVIGDLANYSHQTGQPLPGVAPVAMQQGEYVAEVLQSRLGCIARNFVLVSRSQFRYILENRAADN